MGAMTLDSPVPIPGSGLLEVLSGVWLLRESALRGYVITDLLRGRAARRRIYRAGHMTVTRNAGEPSAANRPLWRRVERATPRRRKDRVMKATLILLGLLFAAGCTMPADEPTAVQPPESGDSASASSKAAVPVKLTAKRIAYQKAEFASGGPYSCAKVVVTNQTKSNLEINPFYFAITGVDGEKRQAAVGAATHEFDTLTLAPGEKASGTVCTETKVAPKVVTFTDPAFDEAARAEVG